MGREGKKERKEGNGKVMEGRKERKGRGWREGRTGKDRKGMEIKKLGKDRMDRYMDR